MIKILSIPLFLLLLVAPVIHLRAQTFYSYQGPGVLREGNLLNSSSFCINPNQLSYLLVDSLMKLPRLSNQKKLTIQPTAISLLTLSNTVVPSGINLGALIPNVGIQYLLSAGIKLKWKDKIDISFAPEYQFAQNNPFPLYPTYNRDWNSYYYFLNHIDAPEKFGENKLNKFYPGQSYIKVKLGKFTAGISTENKWWGPASFNPLILGSNAAGFLHATMATLKPIQTKIGTFEGELIAGGLKKSGIYPREPNRVNVQTGEFLYQAKQTHPRYITGMVYTYQPKWIPGLYIGLAKLSMMYTNELSNVFDLLPLEGFAGNKFTPAETSGRKASMGSWFFRYVMPKENAELYYEYGRSDQSLHVWNLFEKKPYGRGFTAGFKKGYTIGSKKNQLIQWGIELTNLSLPSKEQMQTPPASWYLDDYVRQGFTNRGKVLAAGIGPGSNSQTMYVQWIKGLNKVGLRFNRVIHNLDFYHYQSYYVTDHFNQYWATVAGTLYGSINWKKITLAAEYTRQRDLNYNWEFETYTAIGFENIGNDQFNIGARLLLQYRF